MTSLPAHLASAQRLLALVRGQRNMGSVSDFATALPKEQTKQHIRDRLVYNDWDLYSFVQMLTIRVSALWESTL